MSLSCPITSAPGPVLPIVAGDVTGKGAKRQWRDFDIRNYGEFTEFHDDKFWRPLLGGNDTPAVAGGFQTAGWLPFAKCTQKKTRFTLDHTAKLFIFMEGNDTRRHPASVAMRSQRWHAMSATPRGPRPPAQAPTAAEREAR